MRRSRLAILSLAVALLSSVSIAAAEYAVPPVGEYYCDYGSGRGKVFGPGRGFFLMSEGEYMALDEEVGFYAYDAETRAITFTGGFFGTIEATGEFIGGSYSQIDIAPSDGVYTFCSLQ